MKLINADILTKEISRAPVWTSLSVKEMINEHITYDIVRCRECKYWNTNGKYYDKCEFHGIVSMNANTFCSYGERKSDE